MTETRVERVVISDQEGRDWDITQAVVRYGFDPDRFVFGLGASKVQPFQNPTMATASDSGYPAPADTFAVIGLAGSPARAYRVDDLLDVEVADDVAGGVPVAVLVRPFLPGNSPAVYGRVLLTGARADTLTLSASGWVYDQQSVLFDLETGSMWYRIAGDGHLTAITGAHLARRLEPRAFAVERWDAWRAGNPATLFMLRPPPLPPIGGP